MIDPDNIEVSERFGHDDYSLIIDAELYLIKRQILDLRALTQTTRKDVAVAEAKQATVEAVWEWLYGDIRHELQELRDGVLSRVGATSDFVVLKERFDALINKLDGQK